jgi:hypothetical protein
VFSTLAIAGVPRGLYGLVSFAMSQQPSELGIQTSVVAGPLLRARLFGVTPAAPSMASASAMLKLMLAVALTAAAIPRAPRRARRSDAGAAV